MYNTQTTQHRKPKLALVGNAPLTKDFSKEIDSCDLVIRCNEAKNLGKNSGQKTDILCIVNAGPPAERIIRMRSVQKHPRFPDLSEIWFLRNNDTIANRIIAANDLFDVTIKRLSNESNKTLHVMLKKESPTPFSCPSTGFLAFWFILEQLEYAHYDKYIFGFTFQMWDGHPVAAERKLMKQWCKSRTDLHFVPASNFFLSIKQMIVRRIKEAASRW